MRTWLRSRGQRVPRQSSGKTSRPDTATRMMIDADFSLRRERPGETRPTLIRTPVSKRVLTIRNRCVVFLPRRCVCLAGQAGPALAYTCNDNYYVIRPGTSCIRRPAVGAREAHGGMSRWQRQLFRASPWDVLVSRRCGALGLSRPDGAFFAYDWGAARRATELSLIRPPSRQATTASGQDRRLTRSDLDRARRLFQSMRNRWNKRLRKGRRAGRQRGLPTLLHWPDPQRAAGAAAPLRRVSSRWSATQRILRRGWFTIWASQFA